MLIQIFGIYTNEADPEGIASEIHIHLNTCISTRDFLHFYPYDTHQFVVLRTHIFFPIKRESDTEREGERGREREKERAETKTKERLGEQQFSLSSFCTLWASSFSICVVSSFGRVESTSFSRAVRL